MLSAHGCQIRNDSTVWHDISKMYWARYVLVDQVLRGGGMRSTECPSSFISLTLKGMQNYCNVFAHVRV